MTSESEDNIMNMDGTSTSMGTSTIASNSMDIQMNDSSLANNNNNSLGSRNRTRTRTRTTYHNHHNLTRTSQSNKRSNRTTTNNSTFSNSNSNSNSSSTFSNSIMNRSGSRKCLSDTILHSYKRSQSNGSLSNLNLQSSSSAACIQSASSSSSSTASMNGGRRATRVLSNSGWGANASFNIVQRSAAAKQEISVSLSKIKECIRIIMSRRNQQQQEQQQQQQQQQQYPSPSAADQGFENLCTEQIIQHMSTLALCVQDDYYRIVICNNKGIETIIQTMNIFITSSTNENLMATCNLTLGILSQDSTYHQMKIMEANGINAIVTSMRAFPVSETVCSTAVDALLNITMGNMSTMMYLCQIQDFTHCLNSINDYLYPLSRQNKDILLNSMHMHVQLHLHSSNTGTGTHSTHSGAVVNGADDTRSIGISSESSESCNDMME